MKMKNLFAVAFASHQVDVYQEIPIIGWKESNYF